MNSSIISIYPIIAIFSIISGWKSFKSFYIRNIFNPTFTSNTSYNYTSCCHICTIWFTIGESISSFFRQRIWTENFSNFNFIHIFKHSWVFKIMFGYISKFFFYASFIMLLNFLIFQRPRISLHYNIFIVRTCRVYFIFYFNFKFKNIFTRKNFL